jgi:hypothetical protein
MRVYSVQGNTTNNYSVVNSGDLVTIDAISGNLKIHDGVFHYGSRYSSLIDAVNAGIGKLVWLSDGVFVNQKMPVLPSNTRVFDLRYDRVDFLGLYRFGNGGISMVDSVQSIRSVLDSAAVGSVVTLGKGTWNVSDSVLINRSVMLEGSGYGRTHLGAQSVFPGSVIKNNNVSGKHCVVDTVRGVRFRDLSIVGNSNSGIGLKLWQPSGTNTTMGDITVDHVYFANNGSHGMVIEGPDGGQISNSSSQFNGGFGFVVVNPSSGTGNGISQSLDNTRARKNIGGGYWIKSQQSTLFKCAEAISNTGPEVLYEGGTRYCIGTTFLNSDFEYPELSEKPGPISTILKTRKSRATTYINTYIGGDARRGITLGDSARTTLLINNHFGGDKIDSLIVVENDASSSNVDSHILAIGNNVNLDLPEDVFTRPGADVAWAEIDISDANGSVLDVRSNKTIRLNSDVNLKLQNEGNGDVIAFVDADDGDNRNLTLYGDGDSSAVGYSSKSFSLKVNHNGSGVLDVASGRSVLIADQIQVQSDQRTSFISGSNDAFIYTTNSGGSYPFDTKGNLVLQPRSVNNRDLVVVTGTTPKIGMRVTHSSRTIGTIFSVDDTVEVTLNSSGQATVVSSNMSIDTYGDASLDTLTSLTGEKGDVVILSSANTARDIYIVSGTNFKLGGNVTLSDPADKLMLIAIGTSTWHKISFADNN